MKIYQLNTYEQRALEDCLGMTGIDEAKDQIADGKISQDDLLKLCKIVSAAIADECSLDPATMSSMKQAAHMKGIELLCKAAGILLGRAAESL